MTPKSNPTTESNLNGPILDDLAVELGVSVEALQQLGVTRQGDAWHYPERDAAGQQVGTNRRYGDGRKRAIKGSRRGLCYAMGTNFSLDPNAGSTPDDPVLVVEGMSDTAAGMDLGYVVVGRSTAKPGKTELASLCELLGGRHVVLIAEHDQSGVGLTGALEVADALLSSAGSKPTSVRVVEPPAGVKDLRTWIVEHKADRAEVDAAIRGVDLYTPKVVEAEANTPLLFKPFPTAALPESAAGFIREGALAIGCDEAMLALPMLSMLAGCIGLTRVVQVQRSWKQSCIIWTALIAESGGHKSPALSAVMSTIERIQARYLRDHEIAMQQYTLRGAEHAEDFRSGNSDNGGGAPVSPKPPTPRRVLVSDATVESMAPILYENPRGVLLGCDELASWIGSFDAYKSGKGADVTHWLSMHDAKSMIVDRKGKGTTPISVTAAAVSVTGGIQPAVLERSFGKHHRENGLLARLLIARPPRYPKRWTNDDISEDTEAALADLVDRLLSLEQDIDDDGEPRPRQLPMTAEALEVWAKWYDSHGAEQSDLTGDLAAAWSKLESYALRLALVVLLANDPDASELDAPAMAAGIRLAEWFKYETRRVYAAMNEDESDRETRELLELVQRRGGDINGRELVHASRKIAKVEQAEAALQTLVDAGLGQWEQPRQDGPGRPSARRLTLIDSPTPDRQRQQYADSRCPQ